MKSETVLHLTWSLKGPRREGDPSPSLYRTSSDQVGGRSKSSGLRTTLPLGPTFGPVLYSDVFDARLSLYQHTP